MKGIRPIRAQALLWLESSIVIPPLREIIMTTIGLGGPQHLWHRVADQLELLLIVLRLCRDLLGVLRDVFKCTQSSNELSGLLIKDWIAAYIKDKALAVLLVDQS